MEKNKLSKLSQTVFLKIKENNEYILNTVSNHIYLSKGSSLL